MKIDKLNDLIRDVAKIWESGSVCYMSDSEEKFQREVFSGLTEYLDGLDLKDNNDIFRIYESVEEGIMETKFEVGDKVVWCGVIGIVLEADKENIRVSFPEEEINFSPDGKFFDWHTSPSINICEKAKKKKKYHLYSIKDGVWYKTSSYLNEKGLRTSGDHYSSNWYDLEKIKHENEFIEV